jgi:hypothetical protein
MVEHACNIYRKRVTFALPHFPEKRLAQSRFPVWFGYVKVTLESRFDLSDERYLQVPFMFLNLRFVAQGYIQTFHLGDIKGLCIFTM